MALTTYTGSCHCGAVRFEADLDLDQGTNRCNCSYCRKVRTWFAFARGGERFRLHEGDALSQFRWTPPGMEEPHLTFFFCKHCGVRTFARGDLAALGGTFHAVHVPTLDIPPAVLAKVPVRYINGADGRYDEEPPDTAAI